MLNNLLTTTDPAHYEQYLNEKIATILNLLENFGIDHPEPMVFPSAPEYYRMRAEFSVFQNEDHNSFSFVMFEPHTKPRKRIVIDEFPIATKAINQGMNLLRQLGPSYPEIKDQLFEVDFLCNTKNELIIALEYHRKLDEKAWKDAATKLKQSFADRGVSVNFVGRSRKQQILADSDTLLEVINTADKDFFLYQVEGNFTQPNMYACRNMINFARSCCTATQDSDLLELYCGSGTFTVCLADRFRKVLATEVSRVPTLTALKNIEKNRINNTKLVRLSAVEVTEALNQIRPFRRLENAGINLKEYDFKTLLIDPPRSGLCDKEALDFTARFDRVIYISCGPQSLAADLVHLTKTHRIEKLAFFDQFPYTPHLESGVLLTKI